MAGRRGPLRHGARRGPQAPPVLPRWTGSGAGGYSAAWQDGRAPYQPTRSEAEAYEKLYDQTPTNRSISSRAPGSEAVTDPAQRPSRRNRIRLAVSAAFRSWEIGRASCRERER